MPAYRDNHKAALDRAASLERELHDLQAQHEIDQSRIVALENAIEHERYRHWQVERYENVLPVAKSMPTNANTVLAMSVLSLAMCNIFGPVAWYMAHEELHRIDKGTADPSKRGMVVVSRALAITSTALMLFSGIFMLLSMCLVHI